MNWNALFGVVCIVSFFFPVVVIVYNRFYNYRSLIALLVNFCLAAFYNLMAEGYIPVHGSIQNAYGILSNYLDVPLTLTGLLFFCPNKEKRRIVHLLIACFVGYEIVVTCIHGFKPSAVVYIIGPGFLLVLGYSFYLFVRQVKFSIMHGKNQGRMLMLAAILFAYTCYLLIYYFYYIQRTPYKSDVLLLYFISSIIGSTLMAVGLHLMRARMKELRELKVTRRELAAFDQIDYVRKR